VANDSTELMSQVDIVYASALLELAEAEGSVDATASQIAELRALVIDQPQAIDLLASRILSYEQRDQACVKAFEGKVSDLVLRFLRVLVSKDRFDEFPEIAKGFAHLVDQKHGVLRILVNTPKTLEPQTLQAIQHRLHELTGRQIEVRQTIDDKMIGGVILRVGDELIDGSIRTQLSLLKQEMIEAGRVKAKELAAQA